MALEARVRDHAWTRAARGGLVATTDDRGGAVDTTRLIAAEGDDIVVVPAGPGNPEGPRRVRRVLVATAIVAVVVLTGAIAVAAQRNGSTARVRTTSPPTLSPKPPVAKARPKPTVARTKPAPAAAVTTVPTTVPSKTPQTLVAVPPASGPARTTPTMAPSPAPTTAAPPKQYGASALTWDAPRALTIAAGKTAPLVVTAHNPTDGTVTLPHPLPCTPRLDHNEVCPEMAQFISSGQSASAKYVIDASGIAKGSYTLKIEGVLTIAVTVS
jgi:hypothetical protein